MYQLRMFVNIYGQNDFRRVPLTVIIFNTNLLFENGYVFVNARIVYMGKFNYLLKSIKNTLYFNRVNYNNNAHKKSC